MNARNRKMYLPITAFVLCLAAIFMLMGCGAAASPQMENGYGYGAPAASTAAMAPDAGAYPNDIPDMDMALAPEAAAEDPYYSGSPYETPTITQPQDDRKIVMTAELSIDTTSFEETCSALQVEAEKAGGYTSNASQDGSADLGTRYARFTFRVPADKYTSFMSSTEKTGAVTSRNESSDDVTEQYVDVEARLKSLRTQESRLMELMEKSASLRDLLEVQQQLTQVQYEIEGYLAQRRSLDNMTSYSTITVDVTEVAQPTLTSTDSYGAEIARAFRSSAAAVIRALRGLGLLAAGFIPVLIVLAVLAIPVIIAVLAARRYRKKHPRPTVIPQAVLGYIPGAAPYQAAQRAEPAPQNTPAAPQKPEINPKSR